ncbi:unnamed protein product [Mytilus edulis]|uniref:Uncharacterized protein n=1 Tax=Mytilus edulis TaxID=6550 RepID=A0A8S3UQX3_MYTED|nr:unnamed protein product [Mytilus edulis]
MKRARADTTQVAADQPVPPVTQPAKALPQFPSTHPSADQKAAAMISQLKELELLPFQDRLSSKIIHSQWGTAGPTADQENVPTSQLANSNTSVSDVPKNMQQFHAGKGLQNSTSLPTPMGWKLRTSVVIVCFILVLIGGTSADVCTKQCIKTAFG